jgi:hypothetical protein
VGLIPPVSVGLLQLHRVWWCSLNVRKKNLNEPPAALAFQFDAIGIPSCHKIAALASNFSLRFFRQIPHSFFRNKKAQAAFAVLGSGLTVAGLF